MIDGPWPERPSEKSIGLGDRQIVDAGKARTHVTGLGELPVFIAIGAKPRSAVVAPFVGESHGDAMVGKGPEFLDESIVEFRLPFPVKEGPYLISSHRKFGAVTPDRVAGVDQRDPFGITRIPGIFGASHLGGS